MAESWLGHWGEVLWSKGSTFTELLFFFLSIQRNNNIPLYGLGGIMVVKLTSAKLTHELTTTASLPDSTVLSLGRAWLVPPCSVATTVLAHSKGSITLC